MSSEDRADTRVVRASYGDCVAALPITIVGLLLGITAGLMPLVAVAVVIEHLPPLGIATGPLGLVLILTGIWLGRRLCRSVFRFSAKLAVMLWRGVPLRQWSTTQIIT